MHSAFLGLWWSVSSLGATWISAARVTPRVCCRCGSPAPSAGGAPAWPRGWSRPGQARGSSSEEKNMIEEKVTFTFCTVQTMKGTLKTLHNYHWLLLSLILNITQKIIYDSLLFNTKSIQCQVYMWKYIVFQGFHKKYMVNLLKLTCCCAIITFRCCGC